jgi:hypothetical protein
MLLMLILFIGCPGFFPGAAERGAVHDDSQLICGGFLSLTSEVLRLLPGHARICKPPWDYIIFPVLIQPCLLLAGFY